MLSDGSELCAGKAAFVAVDHVHDVEAVAGQESIELAHHFGGCEVPGHRRPAVRISDDEVEAAAFEVFEMQSRITGSDVEVVVCAQSQ